MIVSYLLVWFLLWIDTVDISSNLISNKASGSVDVEYIMFLVKVKCDLINRSLMCSTLDAATSAIFLNRSF